MLWSVTKIIVFIGLIAVAALGAAFVIDTGGEVRIAFGTQELSLQPIVAVIGFILVLVAAWVLAILLGLCWAIFRFFNGDETAITRYRSRGRERRGFEALADSMVALAAGEGNTAVAKATKAESLLKRPELTHLINAQAAEMTGDNRRALQYYKNLLDNDRTRFVGIKGILKQKLAEGDTETALKLAEKAFAIRPDHGETLNTLFTLQSSKNEWKGAGKTVAAEVRARLLPKDVGKRREAVLALAEARGLLDDGDIEAGKAAALRANKMAPGLVPAAILAAEMHMLDEAKRPATVALKKAWAQNPHPDLAAAFAEIAPDETPTERIKRFAVLTKVNPDHSETQLLRAELALADEDFPAARRAIKDVIDDAPGARALTIMAAVEKGEGAEIKVVHAWLNKALSAPRGPQWICANCSKIHSQWMPICDNCATFDTMDWTSPQESAAPKSSTAVVGLMPGLIAQASPAPLEDVDGDVQVGAVTHANSRNPSKPPIADYEVPQEDADGSDPVLQRN